MIAWLTNLPAGTLSAYAAAVAAAAAATVALLQFFIGMRQSGAAIRSANASMLSAQNAGRLAVATSRQNWINAVIETIAEYHGLLLLAVARDEPLEDDDARRLVALRTKLEILLNPDEQDTIELLAAMDDILEGETLAERRGKSPQMVSVSRRLLKREWVRIKGELGQQPNA